MDIVREGRTEDLIYHRCPHESMEQYEWLSTLWDIRLNYNRKCSPGPLSRFRHWATSLVRCLRPF